MSKKEISTSRLDELEAATIGAPQEVFPPKRGRGRPKGSKNKPKPQSTPIESPSPVLVESETVGVILDPLPITTSTPVAIPESLPVIEAVETATVNTPAEAPTTGTEQNQRGRKSKGLSSASALITLPLGMKEEYTEMALEHGLSFSSLIRLALNSYTRQQGWKN